MMPTRLPRTSSHNAVVVVNKDNEPVGIFTQSDATGLDRFTHLHRAMSTELLTSEEGSPPEVLFQRLSGHRISCAPVLRGRRLVGGYARGRCAPRGMPPPPTHRGG